MTESSTGRPVAVVLREMAAYIVATVAFVALAFILPGVNPYRPPLFDLQGTLALFAYYLTMSGAGSMAPYSVAACVLVLVARPGLRFGRRLSEFAILYLVVTAVVFGWARIEPRLKALLAQPRPVIVALASTPADAPALRMSVEEFYALPEHSSQRHEHLAAVLTPEFTAIPMDDRIRTHWTLMTDYGFPSGHAVGAMLNAIFFLAMGLSYLPARWMWMPRLVLVWGILICYSRPILREHSPTQILGGATIGICLALLAFLVARLLIEKLFASAGTRVTARAEAPAL